MLTTKLLRVGILALCLVGGMSWLKIDDVVELLLVPGLLDVLTVLIDCLILPLRWEISRGSIACMK